MFGPYFYQIVIWIWFASEAREIEIEEVKRFRYKQIMSPRPLGGARQVRPHWPASALMSVNETGWQKIF